MGLWAWPSCFLGDFEIPNLKLFEMPAMHAGNSPHLRVLSRGPLALYRRPAGDAALRGQYIYIHTHTCARVPGGARPRLQVPLAGASPQNRCYEEQRLGDMRTQCALTLPYNAGRLPYYQYHSRSGPQLQSQGPVPARLSPISTPAKTLSSVVTEASLSACIRFVHASI